MVNLKFFRPHRTWEDWTGIALGMVIGLSPLFAAGEATNTVVLVSMLIGLLVLMFAAFEFVDLHRWEEIGMMACGLVLIAMPFIFGYAAAGTLRIWHVGLGVFAAALGLFELWQDWKLSDKDLAKHGQ